jgi:ABC-2 type transport system permease protein
MLSDAIKATLLSIVILLLALAWGAGFETGILGMILLVLGMGVFALGYSGIGVAIALKTGSPQAANAGFILFFPLLFLAPTFAPIDVFADWLQAVARVNPVTYIMEGMRGLIIYGWDGEQMLKAGASVAGICAFTFTLATLALRGRAG